jgi:hypothetical protein
VETKLLPTEPRQPSKANGFLIEWINLLRRYSFMPTERIDFWKGFIMGTLAGMAVAIFSNWDIASQADYELERPIGSQSGSSTPVPGSLPNTA